MTEEFEPAPYLPPSDAAATGPVPVGAGVPTLSSSTPTLPNLTPTLPAAQPATPTPATAQVFDARAMVEANKKKVENPVYGQLPNASAEGRKASQEIRAKANKKRRNRRAFGRLFGFLVLVGLGAGGWFVYQELQDDEVADDAAVQTVTDGESGEEAGDGASAGAGPLTEQAEVVAGLDAVNEANPSLSIGGVMGVVEQAEDLVDDINGVETATEETPTPPAVQVNLDDVVPARMLDGATLYPIFDGYERYVVSVTSLDAIDQLDWPDDLQALPQADRDDPVFHVMPDLFRGQIGVAVRSIDGQVDHVLILGRDPNVAVELAG